MIGVIGVAVGARCKNHPDLYAVWIEQDGTGLCGPCRPRALVPGHFDNPPLNAITAEQVRLNTELTAEACAHGGAVCCDAKRLRWVLEQLAKHPGVSSSARAVIEAACSPASPS